MSASDKTVFCSLSLSNTESYNETLFIQLSQSATPQSAHYPELYTYIAYEENSSAIRHPNS